MATGETLSDAMLDFFVRWGQGREDVRALLLTSTRTVPGATVDRLSDYDLIVAVSDDPGVRPFFESRDWLGAFGKVLVLYRDPLLSWFAPCERPPGDFVDEKTCYVTQYEQDGLKIDFTVMPAGLLRAIARSPLPEDLDLGYLVLLDKDGLTAGMAPPTHRAYIPGPPSLAEYLEEIELFFHNYTYIAKYLWRGDLVPAKQLESEVKADHVCRMLQWQAEIAAGWTVRLKAHGRELRKLITAQKWAALEATYCGAGEAENWAALWRTVELFAQTGREVGAGLGYAYPQEMHERCVRHLKWVESLPPDAETS
jgi:aminoglycoside 6-adenylyltransferase